MKKYLFLFIVSITILLTYQSCKRDSVTPVQKTDQPPASENGFGSMSVGNIFFATNVNKSKMVYEENIPSTNRKRILVSISGAKDITKLKRYILFETDQSGTFKKGRFIIAFNKDFEKKNLNSVDLSENSIYYDGEEATSGRVVSNSKVSAKLGTRKIEMGDKVGERGSLRSQNSSPEIKTLTDGAPYEGFCETTRIDWYITTTDHFTGEVLSEEYVYSTCMENGTNLTSIPPLVLSEASAKRPDDGKLSCKTLNFTKMTSNMYEAGVTGLFFSVDWVPGVPARVFNFRDIFIGFPILTASSVYYSANDAASITAAALNRAGLTLSITYYNMSVGQLAALTQTEIENEFKNLVNFYIAEEIGAAGTASYIQSGANTVTRSAIWNNSYEQAFNALMGIGCS